MSLRSLRKSIELVKLNKNIKSRSYMRPGEICINQYPRNSIVEDQIPRAQYGGRHTVTMIPGSGIGPELMVYLKEVFQLVGAPINFEEIIVPPTEEGNAQLNYAIMSIKRNGVAIKGTIETDDENLNIIPRNVAIRNALDLFVNVIHCKSYPVPSARQKDLDIVIIRQNTEGEYSMLEHQSVEGVIESLKVITESNSERVARYAFEYAQKFNRKMVTTIHKANIQKQSDGLFLDVSRKVAKEYPNIKHNDMIIDNCCMQLIQKPQQFDVMLMPNLYGSIISNVLCGLVGGPGLLSSVNYGNSYTMFEPGIRSIAITLAGKNVANPIAMLNSGVGLLSHIGHHNIAKLIADAIEKTLTDEIFTKDLGGNCTTSDVIECIKENIAQFYEEKRSQN